MRWFFKEQRSICLRGIALLSVSCSFSCWSKYCIYMCIAKYTLYAHILWQKHVSTLNSIFTPFLFLHGYIGTRLWVYLCPWVCELGIRPIYTFCMCVHLPYVGTSIICVCAPFICVCATSLAQCVNSKVSLCAHEWHATFDSYCFIV